MPAGSPSRRKWLTAAIPGELTASTVKPLTPSQVGQARQRLLRHPRPGAGQGPPDGGRGPEDHQAEHRQHRRLRLEPPDEIVQDMIRNLPHTAGYTDSKGLFAPRKAVVHYTQEKKIAGVTVDDVYLGNGASELMQMSMNGAAQRWRRAADPGARLPAVHGRRGAVRRHAGALPLRRRRRLAARPRRHPRKITPRTRGIVVINPNNPTGTLYPRACCARSIEIAPAPADRLRRRDLRQDAVRRRHGTPAWPAWPTTCCSSPSTACPRTTAAAATAPAGWWSRATSAMPATTSRA
jgi:hypothetical protein